MEIAEGIEEGGADALLATGRIETFLIRGLSCQRCAGEVQDALARSPHIEHVTVDANRRFLRTRHRFDDPVPAINRLLNKAGDYRIEPASAVATVLAYLAHYRPLMIMAALVLLFVLVRQALAGWHGHGFMADMMAGYFLLFGALKVVNRKAFAASYARYDALAMQSAAYANAYPFVEIMLGIAYLTMPASVILNLVTMLLMAQKGWSVHRALQNDLVTQCACLGGFFSIPISRVTVAEDLLMAVMAASMLLGA